MKVPGGVGTVTPSQGFPGRSAQTHRGIAIQEMIFLSSKAYKLELFLGPQATEWTCVSRRAHTRQPRAPPSQPLQRELRYQRVVTLGKKIFFQTGLGSGIKLLSDPSGTPTCRAPGFAVRSSSTGGAESASR